MTDPEQELTALIQTAWMADIVVLDAEGLARAIIAAGWVSPEKHRAEVERLTKSVGAFSAARDAAKKGWQESNDKVARVQALAEEWEAGDQYDRDAADYLRAALAEPTEPQ